MKMHKDHEATCLCCTHLRADWDPGYSDHTPGTPLSYRCNVHHEQRTPWSDMGEWTLSDLVQVHEAFASAQRCDAFEGQD